jgi:hypothetical protein
MSEFSVGDYVSILCKDGSTFEGVLQDFDNDCPVPWFLLNGCGFPFEDVVSMTPA